MDLSIIFFHQSFVLVEYPANPNFLPSITSTKVRQTNKSCPRAQPHVNIPTHYVKHLLCPLGLKSPRRKPRDDGIIGCIYPSHSVDRDDDVLDCAIFHLTMYFVFQCRLFPSLSAISASCSIVISSRSTSHMHHFPSVSYLESSCHHCHRLHLLLQTRHRLEHRRCVDRRTFFCHSFGDNSTRLQYFLLFRFYIAFFHSCIFVVVFPVGQ